VTRTLATIAGLVTCFALPLAIAAVRRLGAPPPPTRPPPEELARRHRGREAAALLPMLVLFPLCGLGWYAAMARLYTLAGGADPRRWVLPALLVAGIGPAVPLALVYRLVLGAEGYEEYTYFTQLAWGWDGRRVIGVIAWAVGAGSAILFVWSIARG